MAWFDIGTALRRDRSAAEDDRDESFGAPPGEVEPGVRVAQAILTPLRKEVARVDGPDCDRPLLRILGEIQHDMESGLSDHIAHRVEVDLASAMPTWFSGRRQAENERVNQMTELLGALGDSLFKMQNRNTKSADRIRDGLGHLQANGTHTTQAQMKRIVNSVLKALDEIDAEGELRIAKMSEKIRELHDQVAAKTVEAQIDRLTGIHNRATFDDQLGRILKQATIAPFRFALILIDVDHFKAVNDTHGHVEGDRVLKLIAMELEKVVMRRNDHIARYGGEEFVAILADADAEAGRMIAERIRSAVEAMSFEVHGTPLPITVSVGVAEGCQTDSPNQLIRRADDCVYIAKNNGRNKVIVAGEGAGRRVRLPRALAERAKEARKAQRAHDAQAPDAASGPDVGSVHGIAARS